MDDRANKNMDN